MKTADFLSLRKETSIIGLGCGRLVGGASLRDSTRLVETALDLGIRYFDVAPSYGMGTAEDVLGLVLGGSPEVTVATKVGLPRPSYSRSRDHARRLARRVARRQQSLRVLARRRTGETRGASAHPRFDFSASSVRASVEESLTKLRRSRLDLLLVHEPHREDLGWRLKEVFDGLIRDGLVTAYGVGIDARSDRWQRFGSVWQSAWPGESFRDYEHDVAYSFHGVVRSALAEGGRNVDPRRAVREALTAAPESVVLVSASTPAHLTDLLIETG